MFKPLSNPILFVSDNPSRPGGLARNCRDMASLAATLPEFRVAVLGRGEGTRKQFPWAQYSFGEEGAWGQNLIAEVWKDFAGGEQGVIMTLDDPSRRLWFADPSAYPDYLRDFLGGGRMFRKWALFPIDSTGPDGSYLGCEGRACVRGYDRVLAASEWGKNVLVGVRQDADWLPHGIGDEFRPLDSRESLGWEPEHVWVGSVMANQSRKDFPVLCEAAAELKNHYGNRFRLWIHTDIMIRYWNIYALLEDYGIRDCTAISLAATDRQMAQMYSACDCTLLPSGGEGFGFPIAESLACGTPCIVTDYAAGQELVPEEMRVRPMAYRVDTAYNIRRAVLSGFGFAQAAKVEIERKRQDREFRSQELQEHVSHLYWKNLKYLWMRWFREGLK